MLFHKSLKDGEYQCVHKEKYCAYPLSIISDGGIVGNAILFAGVMMIFSTGLSTHIVYKYWWVKKK